MQLLLLLITGASAAQCVLNTDNDPRARDGYVSLLTCRVGGADGALGHRVLPSVPMVDDS